ncbi:DUF2066 domain-containing protein [Marinobacter sp. OP 3.4]|uniref:DUF2066 domain-containing protein n=1 Tax=Marinobacter sp. OP 3.4 TaxID=3076501 RepID=UPI002E1AED4D
MAVEHLKNRQLRGTVILMTLLWLLVSATVTHGIVVDGLYQAEVPVAGEEDAQLEEGYRAGLEQVLVRVSGDRNVMDREGVASRMENIEPLLESWQVEPGPSGEDQLQMVFSAQGVNRLLADAGASVWGANRPKTLAWIAVQDGGDRGLLVETGDRSGQGWSALIHDNAEQRGLPLVLPPADRASDRSLLSEVWGQFMGQVSRASSGIEHDLLAVVRVRRSDGLWQASWLYQGRGIEQSRSVSADSPEALASAMVDAWAGELASRFAVTGDRIETGPYVNLVVEGIDSPSDYAAIKQALSRLNPVESVGATSVSRDRIVFRVEHAGGVAQLQQNIALDERFQALTGSGGDHPNGRDEAGGANAGTTGQKLFYRWQDNVVAPVGAGEQEPVSGPRT